MPKNKARALARKMMTQAEIKLHISPYDSAAWRRRRVARAQNAQAREIQAQYYAKARRLGSKALNG